VAVVPVSQRTASHEQHDKRDGSKSEPFKEKEAG
jgi:hypothetical protein